MPINSRLQDAFGELLSADAVEVVPESPVVFNAADQTFEFDCTGYTGFALLFKGTYSSSFLSITQSMDGDNWYASVGRQFASITTNALVTQGVAVNSLYCYELVGARRVRLTQTSGTITGEMAVYIALLPDFRGVGLRFCQGMAAHDAAVAGNPLRVAGRALTASYAAVATGDTADMITTLDGRQIVLPGALPENCWSYAAASGGITDTGAVTIKAAAAAGIRNYLRSLQVINSAAVASEFSVRDGSAGTVLFRGYAPASMSVAQPLAFDPPLRGSAATLMEVVMATTATATRFNAQGWIAP